jgi:hypothetical protein
MAKIEGLSEGIAQAWLNVPGARVAEREKAGKSKSGKADGRGRAEKARFDAELERAEESERTAETPEVDATADVDVDLERMLDDIHELGGALARNPSQEAIEDYKKAVRRFMRRCVDEGFGLKERVSGTNILKRKKFLVIEIVDRKLERLAADLLSTQRSQLDILGRVEEVYGLLVDLAG